ncbi:hypothetical protein [Nocardia sp. NPDC050710]|uniref:hypothetical protein n=1 Tax=Nocardia sp. NPDC050710 TaxID=3157220 RepID=UPI0033F495AD
MTDLDDLLASLTPDERNAVAALDARRLEVERARLSRVVAAQVSTPMYGAFASLRMWDVLVRNMEDFWSACDYYMVYEYLNMLDVRSGIEENLAEMPTSLQRKVERVVTDLDRRFREVTEDDVGTELARYSKRVASGIDLPWWRTRKPKVLPTGW